MNFRIRNLNADGSALETEIDQLIYKLYSLTADETENVESRT